MGYRIMKKDKGLAGVINESDGFAKKCAGINGSVYAYPENFVWYCSYQGRCRYHDKGSDRKDYRCMLQKGFA